MGGMNYQVVWTPQAMQAALISCPVFEIFYGGARGGGKTDASIGDFLEHASTYGEKANGIFLRRTVKQLEEVVARTQEIFPKLGAKLREQKGEWKFPNGARLKFRYLERDKDADEYQGHNYTWCGVEEVTNFPSPVPIDKMRATLRSASGVKTRMVLTGNPGGPGHQWVKARYVTPCKTGYKVLEEEFTNPFTKEKLSLQRVFIPAKLVDNKLLMVNDPFYVARLQQQGSKQLVKAWLEGDWDIVLGAFFDCFDAHRHVLPFDWLAAIPRDANRFRAFDWGSARPFSCGWYAVSNGQWGLPRGALLKYREWYGWNGRPNEGLKMMAEDVADGIKIREEGEVMIYGAADPQIFVRDGGPSIAERMLMRKVLFKPADRKRKAGWDQLRSYLEGKDGVPMLYFLETCEATIRTLPTVQHDEHDPEDVDTEGEDHAADETRYGVMSRPWIGKGSTVAADKLELPALPSELTMGKRREQHLNRMRQEREETMQ